MNASQLPYLLLLSVNWWIGATAVHATDSGSPIGFWKGDDATFEMFETEGKLSARIVALSEPKTAEGKEKTDLYNPDPKKRSHPIIGLVFMSGFTKKVTLAGRTGPSMTRRVAGPIPALWNCRARQDLASRVSWERTDGSKLLLGQSELITSPL